MRSHTWLAAAVAVAMVGCQSASFLPVPSQLIEPPTGWTVEDVKDELSGISTQMLTRRHLVEPIRYRLIVVPGSGCRGWGPFINQYFNGALHAEIVLLSKPFVAWQTTSNDHCSAEFLQEDAPSNWQKHAQFALIKLERNDLETEGVPQLLVGISEGAELVPVLARSLPRIAGVAMFASSGLDPREVGHMQALKVGEAVAWKEISEARLSDLADARIVQGRTLRYWRDLWNWRVEQPLLDGDWPLVRVWGDADELVPFEAYERFWRIAEGRKAPFCDLRIASASHSLQSNTRDGVQLFWSKLENWARSPLTNICAHFRVSGAGELAP